MLSLKLRDSKKRSAMPSPAKSQEAKILSALIALQEQGSTAWSNVRRTNAAFYEHIAQVYFWWRDANAINGYLETKYATLGRRFKKVKYGTNYSPLLWLVWGSNNCSDSEADRHSRVLNKLHVEYLRRPTYYARDGVARMATFIAQNNGINGLVGYGKRTDDEGANELPNNSVTSVPESHKKAAAYALAKAFYKSTTGTTVELSNTLPITDDEYGVILVKKSANGYTLLGATNDDDIVQAILVNNYKHEFSALPNSTRCLIETIRSQVLPKTVMKFQHDLIDKSTQKHTDKKNKLAVKRLLYRADTQDFLLSPVRNKSGVVTTAKPLAPVMICDADAILSTRARRLLEIKAVSEFEFNSYVSDCSDSVRANAKHDGASHIARLENIADPNDFFYLDFWQYDEQQQVISQVSFDPAELTEVKWQHALTLDFFKQLTLDIVDKWFSSHAAYIKRAEGKLCLLEFGKDALTINLVLKNEQFELRKQVAFHNPTEKNTTNRAYFKTKDILPVLRSLADYEITNQIDLIAYSSALVIKFTTAAAHYMISIPTTNKNGIRNVEGFKSYEPSLSVRFETDDVFDYQQEAAEIMATASKL